MNFKHWVHHLFNPHCIECEARAITSKVCESCETLKMQLSIANHEKEQMLQSILAFNRPTEAATTKDVDYEKLKPRMTTWNVRRQMLEAEDRVKAEILRKQAAETVTPDPEVARVSAEIEKLEKELGLEETKDA